MSRAGPSHNFLSPLTYINDESLKIRFNFIGITYAGEFVYVPDRFYKSIYVLYYDTKINKFHRVEFKGIADDKSSLKHNLPAVLNHIESLRSF